MKLETRAASVALAAGLGVVGVSYGLSALVAPRLVPDRRGDARGAPAAGAVPPAQLVTAGRRLYGQACASCHGDHGAGAYGPALRGRVLPDGRVAVVIRDGIPPKMPAFAKEYDAAQQQAIVAYVRSLGR